MSRTRPYYSKWMQNSAKLKKKQTQSKRGGYLGGVTGPQTLYRKLRYVDRIIIDPGASSAIGQYFFNANGLFDPDQTGTGHQPMGFDQYMAMYDHYQVVSSKITVSCSPNNATSISAFVWGIYLDDDFAAHSNTNNICEQGLAAYRVQNAGEGVLSTKLSKSFNLKKFLSRNTDNTWGDATANPVEKAAFCIFMQALANSVDVGEARFHVTIDYVVKFSERTTTATS